MAYYHYELKPWWRIRAAALVSSISGRGEGTKRVITHWQAVLPTPNEGEATGVQSLLAQQVAALLRTPSPVVALYEPLPTETPLLEATLTLAPTVQVLVPRIPLKGEGVVKRAMSWHLWQAIEAWESPFKGRVYQQPVANTPVWQGKTPDLCLLPCPLLDDAGIRLGYGGGWYDRQLAAWQAEGKPPLCVGVGLAGQRVRRLPQLPHDKPLHGWLDETGWTALPLISLGQDRKALAQPL